MSPTTFTINAFNLILYQTSFVGNKPNCVVIFRDKSNPLDKLHATTYIADSQFAYMVDLTIGTMEVG